MGAFILKKRSWKLEVNRQSRDRLNSRVASLTTRSFVAYLVAYLDGLHRLTDRFLDGLQHELNKGRGLTCFVRFGEFVVVGALPIPDNCFYG